MRYRVTVRHPMLGELYRVVDHVDAIAAAALAVQLMRPPAALGPPMNLDPWIMAGDITVSVRPDAN